jgi:hypothetical protein
VLDLRSNLLAQLSISEVLQLNADSHNFAILSGVELPVSGATVQSGEMQAGTYRCLHREQTYPQLI